MANGQLRIVRWAVSIATTVIAISSIGGVAAAVLGGPVTDVGNGAGGLYPSRHWYSI